jgi:hypothetical protein
MSIPTVNVRGAEVQLLYKGNGITKYMTPFEAITLAGRLLIAAVRAMKEERNARK